MYVLPISGLLSFLFSFCLEYSFSSSTLRLSNILQEKKKSQFKYHLFWEAFHDAYIFNVHQLLVMSSPSIHCLY